MLQATQARHGHHGGAGGWLLLDGQSVRGVFFQGIVNAIVVMVVHIIAHQPAEMRFVPHDYMVQDLAPAAAHPSFSQAILPRRLNAGPLGFQPRRL